MSYDRGFAHYRSGMNVGFMSKTEALQATDENHKDYDENLHRVLGSEFVEDDLPLLQKDEHLLVLTGEQGYVFITTITEAQNLLDGLAAVIPERLKKPDPSNLDAFLGDD